MIVVMFLAEASGDLSHENVTSNHGITSTLMGESPREPCASIHRHAVCELNTGSKDEYAIVNRSGQIRIKKALES